MNAKITTLLLKEIDTEGDLKRLKHFGFSYRQIAEMIEENISLGNLTSEDEGVRLTPAGKLFLSNNIHLVKETDKSKWIEPDYKNKIQKIGKDDVFLPSRKNLSFQKKLL